ncbi:MAG: nucleotidyltransferase domain-containing protein [Candidatus Omnitrophica bacterium]|nr:nucleotidyltransferase domain-containing protein [Candidatus Omnitrophota bacterium]
MNLSIQNIKNKTSAYFSIRNEIKFAYLFGSRARNEANKKSDIDIAILIDKSLLKKNDYPYGYKAKILTDLLKIFSINDLDLVILNDASPLLRHRAVYFGKLIYCQAEKERIEFQVKTLNEYNDVKRLLSLHY